MRGVILEQRTIVAERQVEAALFDTAPHVAARQGQNDPGEPLGLPALHEYDVIGAKAFAQEGGRLLHGPHVMHLIITHAARPRTDTISIELRAHEHSEIGDLCHLLPDDSVPMPFRRWRHVEITHNSDPPPGR